MQVESTTQTIRYFAKYLRVLYKSFIFFASCILFIELFLNFYFAQFFSSVVEIYNEKATPRKIFQLGFFQLWKNICLALKPF